MKKPIPIQDLRIGTNWGGERVFSDLADLRHFVLAASEAVADISNLLRDTHKQEDETLCALVYVNNDLAYQLQGACALLAAQEGGAA